MNQLFSRAAFAGLLLLGSACEVVPPDVIVEVPDDGRLGAGPDEAVDPSVPGPFAVGVTTFVVTDPNRLNPVTGEPRQLITEVWYPADESTRNAPREDYGIEDLLTPEQIAQTGIDPNIIARLPSTAGRDVAPRTDQGPYPLIIFSHGNGGIRMQSIFLTEHLASHGYIVASMDHEGNTLSTVFDSGQGFPDDIVQVAQDRPVDASLVIDAMLARNETNGDVLQGLIDPEEIGITGHSFGAYTSLAVSALDPRIDASAPLAPPSSFALAAVNVSPSRIFVDTMIFAGNKDLTLPFEDNQLEVFTKLDDKKRALVNILDAGHFTFSDICVFDLELLAQLAGIDTQGVLDDGCGAENIDPVRGHEITNTFATVFFNSILRDSFPSRLLMRDLFNQLDPIETTAQVDLSFPVNP